MEIIDDHQQEPFINVRETVPAETVINRVSNFWSGHKQEGKSQILVVNRMRVLGSGLHTPA